MLNPASWTDPSAKPPAAKSTRLPGGSGGGGGGGSGGGGGGYGRGGGGGGGAGGAGGFMSMGDLRGGGSKCHRIVTADTSSCRWMSSDVWVK